MLTKKQRVYNAVNGLEVDRQPYAIWTHLPGIDLDPDLLAHKTYEFFRKYDIDLIKTMNNGMYAIEDYGCTVDYSEIELGGVAKLVDSPVKVVDDWAKIARLDLENAKSLQRELHSLEVLLDLCKDDDVPVLFTCFSPMTTAQKLCGNKLIEMIRQGDTKLIHQALQNITDVTIDLVKKAISLGADGVYFATQLSNYNVCTVEEYKEFGAYYDKQVLAASTGFADAIHCHGDCIMYEVLKDYPVDIFNWHVWESDPSFEEVINDGKCVMGGIVRGDITNSNFEAIEKQIRDCYNVSKGKKHILSAGCVIRYPLNDEALQFVGDVVRKL